MEVANGGPRWEILMSSCQSQEIFIMLLTCHIHENVHVPMMDSCYRTDSKGHYGIT